MIEYNFIEASNIFARLNDHQQFRLNKFTEVKYYFVAEIKERD